MDPAGRTVLVTGAARRVGRAIALELGRAGARLALHCHASRAEAEAVAEEIVGAGAPAPLVLEQDLREPEGARRLVERVVAKAGSIDALVNNAAVLERAPLGALDDRALTGILDVNLAAPLRLSREAVAAGASAIVNVVDVAAAQPWANHVAYAASKAGLAHATRCLAVELAPRVRVNAVAPGTVLFPEDWPEERRQRQRARIPLGREGTPEDVARAVRFLLESGYLTGVVLPVDGGSSLR